MNDIEAAIKTTVNIEKLFNKSVLITGATGLVGSFLVKMFIELNDYSDANISIYALARDEARVKELFGFAKSWRKLREYSIDLIYLTRGRLKKKHRLNMQY